MTNSSLTSKNEPEIVLSVQGVSLVYKMPSVRYSTLKEAVIARLMRRSTSRVNEALKNVSFEARRGECIAFIGHNGCGKSTLLKVIAGILKPKLGQVYTKGRLAPLIELGAGFDPELTGRENVYLACSLMGLTRKEIDLKWREIYDFSELGQFFDAPVKTYSSGMYMRLGFSCSIAIDADLLLIDEILAVGDSNFQRKCIDRMSQIRKSGATIILVSHDLNVVKHMADHVLVFDGGEMVFAGEPRDATIFYQALMDEKLRQNINPYDGQISDKRDIVLAKLRNAVKRGRILEATLKSGESDMRLISGKPWSLIIKFELYEEFKEPICLGFALHDDRDVRMGGTNTNEGRLSSAGVNFDRTALTAKGCHTVEFQFDSLNIASGKYNLFFALHDSKISEAIDLINRGFEVTVENPNDQLNKDHDLINFSGILSKLKSSN